MTSSNNQAPLLNISTKREGVIYNPRVLTSTPLFNQDYDSMRRGELRASVAHVHRNYSLSHDHLHYETIVDTEFAFREFLLPEEENLNSLLIQGK